MFAFETLMATKTYSVISGMVASPNLDWMRRERADKGLPPSRTAKGLTVALNVQELPSAVLRGIPYKRVLLCSQTGHQIFYDDDRVSFNKHYGLSTLAAEHLIPTKYLLHGL